MRCGSIVKWLIKFDRVHLDEISFDETSVTLTFNKNNINDT